KVIAHGREETIDVPKAEFSTNGKTSRRYFAQLAGAGLDARAIELVHWPLKKRVGPLAYVWAGLRAMTVRQSLITASAAQQSVQGQLVLIGNGRFYGGRYSIFPKADLRDGLLDVCIFPQVNWWTLVRCGPDLLLRGKLPPGKTELFQAKEL